MADVGLTQEDHLQLVIEDLLGRELVGDRELMTVPEATKLTRQRDHRGRIHSVAWRHVRASLDTYAQHPATPIRTVEDPELGHCYALVVPW